MLSGAESSLPSTFFPPLPFVALSLSTLKLDLSPFFLRNPSPHQSAPPKSKPAAATTPPPAKSTATARKATTISSTLLSHLKSTCNSTLSSAKALVASLPPLPLPETSPDLFRAMLSSAPVSKAKKIAAATKRRLAHPSPGILHNDKERHFAIYVLGGALLVWLFAAAAGAAAGDGGACVAFGKAGVSSSTSSLAAAASCARGGKLPLLWFDGLLRKAGPLLPLPLLLSRAAVTRGGGSGGGGGRPAAHFIHVAFVYLAAAAARLAVYLPHRAGLLGKVASFPSAVLARVGGGAAAVVAPSQGLQARASALAARAAAAAAPFTSLLPFSSFSSSSKESAATHHLMSDHLFLGACVGAVLCAEGVLLLSDARRHGSNDRTRVRFLLAGAALCASLYFFLCLDMAFTAAYFHARHESAAAVVAGLVAFQAPLALWLLGGVKEARRAVIGAVGGSMSKAKKKSAVAVRSSRR